LQKENLAATKEANMPKQLPQPEEYSPFAKLVGWNFTKLEDGHSQCILEVNENHLNVIKRVHGGVVYSLADVGMAGAVSTYLEEDEVPATIEVKINYFLPATSGVLTCESRTIHISGKLAVAESEIENEGRLIAKAIGTFHRTKRTET